MSTSRFIDRNLLRELADQFDTSDEERRDLINAVRAVPLTAGSRGAFALPIPTVLANYGQEQVKAYQDFAAQIPPVGSPFGWDPLAYFVLRWSRAGNITYPDLPIMEGIAQLIRDQIPKLKDIPAIQTLALAADNNMVTFFRQGAQSTALTLNCSVNDVADYGKDWIVWHVSDGYYPALQYIQWGYNAGAFALFGVDGEQEYYDMYPTGCTIRLSWS